MEGSQRGDRRGKEEFQEAVSEGSVHMDWGWATRRGLWWSFGRCAEAGRDTTAEGECAGAELTQRALLTFAGGGIVSGGTSVLRGKMEAKVSKSRLETAA